MCWATISSGESGNESHFDRSVLSSCRRWLPCESHQIWCSRSFQRVNSLLNFSMELTHSHKVLDESIPLIKSARHFLRLSDLVIATKCSTGLISLSPITAQISGGISCRMQRGPKAIPMLAFSMRISALRLLTLITFTGL